MSGPGATIKRVSFAVLVFGRLAKSWVRVSLSLAICFFVSFSLMPVKSNAGIQTRVRIAYIEWRPDRPPTLSNLQAVPNDQGLEGARLGIRDVNAGGQFTGHELELSEYIFHQNDETSRTELTRSRSDDIIIANMPAAELIGLADQDWAKEALIINVSSANNSLRLNNCRANILHTIPSRAMLSDALAQFLLRKRWNKWFLISGGHAQDKKFSEAMAQSARKFGAKIVAQKTWLFDADMRRNVQAEVPLFTQGPDYDVLVVADEIRDFGEYVLYQTWRPRPVVGTQGLRPVAWHGVIEQWGAAQLQKRFLTSAHRAMNDVDYAAWLAVSAVGEAVIRGGAKTATQVTAYLQSDKFKLAAFKGRRLSFRPWSGQMRQPIALVHHGALVSTSPQEGYLHQRTDLDTLGYDKRESTCQRR